MDAKKFVFKQKEITTVKLLYMRKKVLFVSITTACVVLALFILPKENTQQEPTKNPGWYKQLLEIKGIEGRTPGLIGEWFKTDQQNKVSYKKDENSLKNIQELSPASVGGRTRSIVIDHSNSNHLITAGVSGGIWTSSNNGSSWSPVNDNAISLSVTCITQSPFNKDLFYYGSGEPMGNSAAINGIGVFKSDDNAQSFFHLSHTSDFSGIWDIAHSLTKDSTVYVATQNSGLWRSTDAGNSFSKIYSTTRQIHEIKVFEDSTIMIAEDGYGITKIDENTLDLNRLITNWPQYNYGRISFDYCKDYPNVIYAHLANTNGTDIEYALKSSNGGESWYNTSITTTKASSYAIAWYAFKVSVCPTDSNFVLSLSVDPYYSSNGGSSWSGMGDPHSDYHEVTWYNGNQFLVGCDGGINRFNKSNMAAFTNLNNGLNITQFYAGNYSSAGNILIAGSQDNGTHMNLSGTSQFSKVLGGDGAFCAVDQQSNSFIYGSTQNLNIYRLSATTNVKISNYITNSLGTINNTWFINPFEVNPADSRQIYVPTKREVFRSVNAGNTWIKLTKVLGGDPYCIGIGSGIDPTIYIGGTSSRLYRVNNAATTVAEQEVFLHYGNNSDFANSTIGCIEVDPNNSGTIYCGLVNNSSNSRIWKIIDADTEDPTWFDISSNLPSNMAVNWIEVDPQNSGHIYAATDYGLYTSLNDGASWQKEERLPNVPIDQIRLRHSDRKLFIFTHGRGAWTADLLDNPVSSVPSNAIPKLELYPNPAANFLLIKSDNVTCKLYNSSGIEVLTSTQKKIDVSELQPGIYFAELFKNGNVSVQKVIISR